MTVKKKTKGLEDGERFRFIAILFSLLLLSSLSLAFAVPFVIPLASAGGAEGPTVMITSYKVNPEVLMPGDNGTITVTITNMNTQASETTQTTSTGLLSTTSKTSTRSITAKIESIRLSSSSRNIHWLREGSSRSDYYNVGALGPGQSTIISLPIKAEYNEGTYHPEVCIEVENGENVRFPIPVRVVGSGVEIFGNEIPSEISLSESKPIKLIVATNRPNCVNGVIVIPKARAKNESLDFLFMPPDGIFIGNLAPYEQKEVEFTLTPLSTGNKNVIFEVIYKNGDNLHRNELRTSIFAGGISPVRLILVDAPKSVSKGEIARIEFDVANGMGKNIKAASVIPITTSADNMRVMPSEEFIGDIEADDVLSASFDVDTSDLSVGENEIGFKLIFRDADTDRIYETEPYEVHIEVKESHGGDSKFSPFLVFALILLLVVGLVVYVVYRSKAKEKKKMK
jgi:hypothetical protein